MEPREAIRIREQLGYKPIDMAIKLHVTESTIRKWESGASPIKGPAFIVYRMLQRRLKKGKLRKTRQKQPA